MESAPVFNPDLPFEEVSASSEPVFNPNQPFETIEEKGLLERGADYIGDVWSGDSRREYDIPELPTDIRSRLIKGQGIVGARLSLGRDDTRKAGIAKQLLGDEIRDYGADRHGNAWVTIDDKNYYLNRPGASRQDVDDIFTMVASEVLGATIGGRLGLGMGGVGGRVIGSGVGAGGASIGQDLAAKEAGSGQGIDGMSALLATTFGAGSELMAPMLGPWFRKYFKRGDLLDDSGKVTKIGRDAMERLGLDADKMTDDVAARFEELAKGSASVDDLVANVKRSDAEDLGVRLSRGDVTGDVTEQAFEDAASKGAYGDGAKNVIAPFRASQTDDLSNARGLTSGRIGGDAVSEVGEGMDAARLQLGTQFSADKKAAGSAYKAAKEGRAYVSKDGINELSKRWRRGIGAEYGESMADFKPLMDQIKRLEKLGANKSLKGVSVREMDNIRKQLRKNITKTAGEVQDGALQHAIKIFDGYMDEAAENALLIGDDTVLDQFKKARLGYRQFKQKWTGDKIFEDIMKKQDGDFVLDSRDAANKLFGQTVIGNKQGATKAISRIKDVLGEESQQFKALQQEAFLRLFKNSPDGIEGFKSSFDKAMKSNPEFMRQIFGKSLSDVQKLRRVVGYATDRAPGAVNHSGSGLTVSRILADVFGPVGRVANTLAERFGGPFKDAASTARARASTTGPFIMPPRPQGVGLLGGAGGAGGAHSSGN